MTYDTAHLLAKELRNSDEYKRLIKAQAEVEKDESTLKMVRDFMHLQMQWEYSRMAKSEEAEKFLEKLQPLSMLISNNKAAKEYVEAYTYWSHVFQDVYKIVSGPMQEGVKILEEE